MKFCSQTYTCAGLTRLKNAPPEKGLFTYIIKGYPQSLRRKIIKNVFKSANCGQEIRYDYSGAPISVFCRDMGFSVIDGAYPFCREPVTYGVTDTVIDLSTYQNSNILRSRKDEVLFLLDEIMKQEKRCSGYISAAKSLCYDYRRIESASVIKSAVSRLAAKLWKEHGISPTGRIGTETKYFADVLTPRGMEFPFSEFNGMCEEICVINDFSSAVSGSIADKIRLYALSCGLDVITFIDFLDGETVRHIIIPNLKYGIYTERTPSAADLDNVKRIRISRLINREYSESFKNRAAFYKKTYGELISEAASVIKTVECLKSKLDEIYLSAADSEKLAVEITARILNN